MTTRISTDNIQQATINTIVSQAVTAVGGSIAKISSIAVANSSYTILDDTAVSISGGFIVITGTGFSSGCQVIINEVAANSTTFVNSTTVRAQIGARAAGTYNVYLINPDGGTAIRVNGITYSGTPTWVTDSTLPSGAVDTFISLTLNATGANSYALQAGSSLPSGLTLSANGLLSGTISGITDTTVYNFTIDAIDAELQDSPRSFNVTITANDPQFNYVSLLVSNNGQNNANNNIFLDSSVNNYSITRTGNTTQGTFSPYGDNWSNFFDGTGDFLSVAGNSAFSFPGDFTVEFWVYLLTNSNTSPSYLLMSLAGSTFFAINMQAGSYISAFLNTGSAALTSTDVVPVQNAWSHIALVRSGSTVRIYVNGVASSSTATNSSTLGSSTDTFNISNGNCPASYISNFRVVKGTAVYTGNFTPPTTPLQPIANTTLLTCRDGSFIDDSANRLTITRNGDVRVSKFSPFSIVGLPTPHFGNYFAPTATTSLRYGSNTNLSLGSGNFTVEFFVYVIAYASFTVYAEWRTNGGVPANIPNLSDWNGNNRMAFLVTTGSGVTQILESPSVVPLNRWLHVALVRSGTTVTLYWDGVSVATGTSSANFGIETFSISNPQTANYNMNGHVSNFRIVRGSAVYTSNFTPPTTPLQPIANTTLLTCRSNTNIDLSNNNFAVTSVGNTTPSLFSPFTVSYTPTQAYSTSTFGGSMAFDGSGDFLSVASNTAFDLGSSNFTIECWFNSNSFASGQGLVSRYGGGPGWALILNSATVIRFIRGNDVLLDATVTAMNVGSWNHIAVVRSGSVITTYLNGTQVAQATGVVNFTDATTALQIGRTNTITNDMNGFISDVRVIRGTALYTSNFVPPMTPATAIANTSLLLNSTNAAIFDASMKNNLDTFNDARLSTSIKRYGNSSIFLDGTTDYVIVPTSTNFGYNTGNFTIEFWVYFNTVTADQTIISNLTSVSSVNPHLYLSSTGTIRYYTNSADRITSSAVNANTWYHVALSRSSGSTRLFVNGTQNGSTFTDTNNYGQTAPLGIGTYLASGIPVAVQTLNGYIQDIRVTLGFARYTANFTPPGGNLPLR